MRRAAVAASIVLVVAVMASPASAGATTITQWAKRYGPAVTELGYDIESLAKATTGTTTEDDCVAMTLAVARAEKTVPAPPGHPSSYASTWSRAVHEIKLLTGRCDSAAYWKGPGGIAFRKATVDLERFGLYLQVHGISAGTRLTAELKAA